MRRCVVEVGAVRPISASFVLLALVSACAGGDGTGVEQRPLYPTCPETPTPPGALAAKAAHFDDVAIRWHMPQGQDLIHNAHLKEDLDTFDWTDPKDNTGLW